MPNPTPQQRIEPMTNETITKAELAEALGEIWSMALSMREQDGRPMEAVCKTLADRFEIEIKAVRNIPATS